MPSPGETKRLIDREAKNLIPIANYQKRIVLHENFQLGRPVLAATLDPSTINQAAVRLLTGANKRWIISGTNAANAGSALNIDGGIALATAGADNDQIILSPATAINSVAQSLFRVVEWEPEHAVEFEAHIDLPSIANVLVQVGLGLTANLDLTTDNDKAAIQFSTEGSTSTTKFTGNTSIGGVDQDGIASTKAPIADKTIRLKVRTDSARMARFYVNDVEFGSSPALTAGVNFIPYIGIQALAAAAKTIKVREIFISRYKIADV